MVGELVGTKNYAWPNVGLLKTLSRDLELPTSVINFMPGNLVGNMANELESSS